MTDYKLLLLSFDNGLYTFYCESVSQHIIYTSGCNYVQKFFFFLCSCLQLSLCVTSPAPRVSLSLSLPFCYHLYSFISAIIVIIHLPLLPTTPLITPLLRFPYYPIFPCVSTVHSLSALFPHIFRPLLIITSSYRFFHYPSSPSAPPWYSDSLLMLLLVIFSLPQLWQSIIPPSHISLIIQPLPSSSPSDAAGISLIHLILLKGC